MISILFVCMGNICRSPAAAATLHHLAVQKGMADQLTIDSCGLGWFHLGERPDPRTFEAAKKRGVLLDHRARQFSDSDLEKFDYIFAVDHETTRQIKLHAKNESQKNKVHLATEFGKKYKGKEMVDPYYMGNAGFDHMMDLVFDACEGILSFLEKKLANR